ETLTGCAHQTLLNLAAGSCAVPVSYIAGRPPGAVVTRYGRRRAGRRAGSPRVRLPVKGNQSVSPHRGAKQSWGVDVSGIDLPTDLAVAPAEALSATTLLPLWPEPGRTRRKSGHSGSSVFLGVSSSWCGGVSPRSGFVISRSPVRLWGVTP